jgi:hypothetical protein
LGRDHIHCTCAELSRMVFPVVGTMNLALMIETSLRVYG